MSLRAAWTSQNKTKKDQKRSLSFLVTGKPELLETELVYVCVYPVTTQGPRLHLSCCSVSLQGRVTC